MDHPDASLRIYQVYGAPHQPFLHYMQAAMLNASSLNSTLNATQSLLSNSVSAGSVLLRNSTLLGTAANQSANTTHLAAQSAASGACAKWATELSDKFSLLMNLCSMCVGSYT